MRRLILECKSRMSKDLSFIKTFINKRSLEFLVRIVNEAPPFIWVFKKSEWGVELPYKHLKLGQHVMHLWKKHAKSHMLVGFTHHGLVEDMLVWQSWRIDHWRHYKNMGPRHVLHRSMQIYHAGMIDLQTFQYRKTITQDWYSCNENYTNSKQSLMDIL